MNQTSLLEKTLTINGKSLLEALRTDIAVTKNETDLLRLINSQLKKLINFTHIIIGVTSEDGRMYKVFLQDKDLDELKSTVYNQGILVGNCVSDGVYNQAVKAGSPIVVDLEELMTKKPPSWIKMNYETGAREMVIAIQGEPARKYNFILFSDIKNNFNHEALEIIEHVACHLATAVTKIRINEEIQEVEKEKSILLALSHGMATVRDKADLARIIKQKIAGYFNAVNFAVSIISEDRQSHSILICGNQSGDMIDDRPDKENFVIDDDIFDRVVLSQEPLTFSLSRLKKMAKIPRYIFLYDEKKSDKLIGVRLKAGETVIGCVWLQTSVNISMILLKGVCAQISIAVLNIIGKEKIAAQLEIINSYKKQIEKETSYVQEQKLVHSGNYDMIGSSRAIKSVYELINQVAYSNSTVLITGETGTGKELAAMAIHTASPRKNNPMIKVNCAAIPANLIESELFGHEKGSFTGAVERRIGKFEMANNGTLFLDEIGEMPFELQAKLLRTLQEREIERLGGNRTIKIDVRIIVATNRELKKEVENGRFRPDLYYRLNVFPIALPSLRERKEDIQELAAYFLERYNRSFGKRLAGMSSEVEQDLLSYHWPGNVRELEHIIERSTLMATSGVLKEVYLPKNNFQEKLPDETFSFKTIKENERDHILQTLRRCGGKISGTKGAAKLLGVPVSTLGSKINKLNITKEEIFQIRI
ncbi:sigma 54-interacting transcriptional regulator [Mucilaginibacter angelicae]|uniref:Sigma 54-interacting transcriptional regulator n=1 Tax=Mucilaginibacter angelicae TaxID=869718 RepID=A0ABV6KZP0_9SPHI